VDLRLGSVVVDCNEPQALAAFWRAALNLLPEHESENWVSIVSAGSRVRLAFQRVPEDKTVKNRLHLDLDTTDVALEVDRLAGLGATWLYDSPHQDDVFTTMADPEGNEFCVVLAK
jgi:hypothetical protein